MVRKKKDGTDYKPSPPVYCDVEGCPDAARNLGTAYGLKVHKHYKHGMLIDNLNFLPNGRKKKMSEKAEEKNTSITPNSEVTSTTTANNIDLAGLMNKIDTLTKMIPPNLCDEFPNLCRLGDRVDGIEKRIKDAIPKKIIVNVPKQVMPDVPVPVVDINMLSKNIVDGISPRLKIDTDPLTQAISAELKTMTEAIIGSNSEDIETKKAKKLIAEIAEVENSVHKTAGDYFNCPECRQSLLKALQEKINNDKEHDTDVSEFLVNIREALTPINEGSHEHHEHETDRTNGRSDNGITTADGGRDEDTRSGEEKPSEVHNATEEAETPNTLAGEAIGTRDSGESKYDSSGKCVGGWCLLSKNRKTR